MVQVSHLCYNSGVTLLEMEFDMAEVVQAENAEKPSRLRSRIMAGLALVVPIWITSVLVMFVFRIMRDASLWIVEAWLKFYGEPVLAQWGMTSDTISEKGLGAFPLLAQVVISLSAVVLTVVLLYALGTVTTHVLGKRLVNLGEMVVSRVPLVAVVYHATKKVVETFGQEGGQAFKKVVLVPYPHREMLTVGFVTSEPRSSVTGEQLFSVFVPTVPNPTTGFVFIIRCADALEVDWTVEEAFKVIISGGVLTPDTVPFQVAPALAQL